MTKASGGWTGTKGVSPPQSPAKAASPATKYSPSPKKEKEGKKADIKMIVIVSNPDATPFGWAFHGFYDAKEFLNSLPAKSFRWEQNSYFLVGTYSIST